MGRKGIHVAQKESLFGHSEETPGRKEEEGSEQVLAQRDVRSPALASQLRQVLELGELLDVIAANVSLQKEGVKFVHSAAEESLGNVRAGNEELMEATKRPSSLRDAAVVLLLSLWALIVFLDWFNP